MSNTKAHPKIALVHDWLNSKVGGGEQVLLELAGHYPNAQIYTLLYNKNAYQGLLDEERVHSSVLQKYPAFMRNHARYLLPFAAGAIERFNFDEYDIVISTSSAFAKGVITRPETMHLSYCFSPMRYVWDYWPRYVTEQRVGLFRKAAIHLLTSKLRLWDYYSSKRVDYYVAISKTVQARIKKYYGLESDMLYPPVSIKNYTVPGPSKRGDYFVTLASLTPYKKIDLAIAACNLSGRRLIVIGDGPDRKRLEALAGSTISFAGRVSQEEKASLLQAAKALIFPQEEDFGIAPLEALASGSPVVAYGRGGTSETIVDGKIGVLFAEQTVEGLLAALDYLGTLKLDPSLMTSTAKQYDTQIFLKNFDKLVKEKYSEFQKNS